MTDRPKARENQLAELGRQFRAPLLAYFARRVRNRADAEDLTQEVFIRLATHPDRKNGLSVDAYVFTIAANLLRDHYRIRKTRHQDAHESFEAEKERFSESLAGDFTPERVLMGKETLQTVVRALGELSERTKDIFILSRLEDVPQREIAQFYGISIKTVEWHIARALVHLGLRLSRND